MPVEAIKAISTILLIEGKISSRGCYGCQDMKNFTVCNFFLNIWLDSLLFLFSLEYDRSESLLWSYHTLSCLSPSELFRSV